MAADGANMLGAYPVYNTNGSANYFLRNIEYNKQRRAQEQKALQDDLSQVKIDGIRDADRNDYFKGYDDWRSTAQQAYQERDFRKKAELQAEAQRKKLELQDLVNQSKQYGKDYRDFKSRLLDDNLRDQFTDDAITQLQVSDKLPLRDSRFIKDFTTLGRQVNLSKVDEQLSKLDNDLLSRQQESNPVTGKPIKAGNRTGTTLLYKTSVDPKSQMFNYGLAYDANRDIKAYFKQQYPDLYAQYPEDQAKAMAIQDFVTKRPLQKVRQSEVWNEKYDNWMEKADYYDKLARRRLQDKSGDETVLYRQQWVSDILNKVDGSGEKLKSILGNKSGYREEPRIQWKGDNLHIYIPNKTDVTVESTGGKDPVAKTKTIPGKEIVINSKQSGADSKINELLNDVLDEKIPESKFKTGNAGGKIKTSKPADNTTKMVTFVLPNGQSGQVPENQVSSFLKKYPKAKRQ